MEAIYNVRTFSKAHNHYDARSSLDTHPLARYRRYMAESILTFDFGTNEEGAQQARHKIEGWKQGFRLGSKMVLKFERDKAAEQTEQVRTRLARPSKSRQEKASGKETSG